MFLALWWSLTHTGCTPKEVSCNGRILTRRLGGYSGGSILAPLKSGTSSIDGKNNLSGKRVQTERTVQTERVILLNEQFQWRISKSAQGNALGIGKPQTSKP